MGSAEPLYQHALHLGQPLSLEHPKVAQTLHDLAAFQERQGNSQEACALLERALAIRNQALGKTHPKTLATREGLTALRVSRG